MLQNVMGNGQALATILSALIAAIAALFAAIYARRTQKSVSSQQLELQKQLEAMKDTLGRGREFAGFRRERIGQHIDHVIDGFVDIYAVAQLIPLRKWLHSGSDLETEARFRLSLSKLRAHFGALESLGVIDEKVSKDFKWNDAKVLMTWNDVLGEAARRTPEYQKENPDAAGFSSEQYHKCWMSFMTAMEELGITIKSLSQCVSSQRSL